MPSSLPESTRASSTIRLEGAGPGPETAVGSGPRRTSNPRRAPGLELIGEYEGSGLKESPFLVRRADGQVVQLSHLLYRITELADGKRSPDDIARVIRHEAGGDIDLWDVSFLIDKKLRPTGVIVTEEDSGTPERAGTGLLGLKFRARVIPAGLVRAVTWLFYPLFLKPVVVAIVLAFAALDAWLFFFHGVARPVREAIYEPSFVLLVFGLTVLSAAFHEFGHATACRFSGGKPGGMGVGLYLVWPAFFTDVTDAYRLDRAGRVRTDLGGVYFNAIFSLGTAAAYFITGYEALLLVVVTQHAQMLYQFLPFLRLDGYYLVADVTGVPDLFARVGPVLRSLVPGKSDERARDLKPWVRVVVTVWVLSTVGFLLYMAGAVLMTIPRMAATFVDSFALRLGAVRGALDAGDSVGAAAHGLQLAALVLPTVGLVLLVMRLGRRAARTSWGWMRTSSPRSAFAAGFAGAALALVITGAPTPRFMPISPNEKWTADEPVRMIAGDPSEAYAPIAAAATSPRDLGVTADTTSDSAESLPAATPTIGRAEQELVPGRGRSERGSLGPTASLSPTSSPSPTVTASPSPSPSESTSSSPSPSPSPSPSDSSSPSPSPSPSESSSP